MSTVIDVTLAHRLKSASGVPVTTQSVELTYPGAFTAYEAAVTEGAAVADFELGFLVPALQKLYGEFRKTGGESFDDFVAQKLATAGDPLLQSFFAKRGPIQDELDRLKAFYEDGMGLRAAVQASTTAQQKLNTLLAEAQAQLGLYDDDAVEASVQKAAAVLYRRSPREESIHDSAIKHAAYAPVYRRVLTARIALLQSQLSAEVAKSADLDAQLTAHVGA